MTPLECAVIYVCGVFLVCAVGGYLKPPRQENSDEAWAIAAIAVAWPGAVAIALVSAPIWLGLLAGKLAKRLVQTANEGESNED